MTEKEKILKNNLFWGKKASAPLISLSIGSQFPARDFCAGAALLGKDKKIEPDMIVVEDFLPEYEKMYRDNLKLEQDVFWNAVPFNAIPWMEAILGCEIYTTMDSFWAKPCADTPMELQNFKVDADNPWLAKFMEFINKLVKLSQGRFPVGEPIMRGPSDMVAALLGQDKFIYHIFDYPEKLKELALKVTEVFARVIRLLMESVPPFNGGYCLGHYQVWSPDKCIWFQEDMTALCNPDIYREIFLECDRMISGVYKYSAIHLHSTSLFVLEELLGIKELKAIEVNKDTGGLAIEDMLHEFRKILDKKCLIIDGWLVEEDIKMIHEHLPCEGLFLKVTAETSERAEELGNFINSVYR